VSTAVIQPQMFKSVYSQILNGSKRWQALDAGTSKLYGWDAASTYIANPPFFASTQAQPQPIKDITNAYCLLNMGDSITTDHISPAGKIANNSPAARYLQARGVQPADFNTYGARRGNFEVMARGTFANTRLINKLMDKVGPNTIHIPTGEKIAVYDAAEKYIKAG
jgi:aconitate hydratase